MRSTLRQFLIIIISCLACFLSVQQTLAEQQSSNHRATEIRKTFKELAKVIRIFELGEIEAHLKALDKSDPLSLGEANLILAYHNDRIGLPKLAAEHFEKGHKIVKSNRVFEKSPFWEAYSSIINLFIFQDFHAVFSPEDQMEAMSNILALEPKTLIQQTIACLSSVRGAVMTYQIDNNLSRVASGNGYCGAKYNLQHMPFVGIGSVMQSASFSLEDRAALHTLLTNILYDGSADPYARIEAATSLLGGLMSARQDDLALEIVLFNLKLIEEYELNNSPLHLTILLASARIAEIWGNDTVYDQIIVNVDNIINKTTDKAQFFKKQSTDNLTVISRFISTDNIVEDILTARWGDFASSNKGWGDLKNWVATVHILSESLYYRENKKDLAINILNSFLSQHDQGPNNAKPFKIDKSHGSEAVAAMKKVNDMVASGYEYENKILPTVYKLHKLIAEFESHRGKDKVASKNYQLAWERMPESIKFQTLETTELLYELVRIYGAQQNYAEAQETASLLLDTWETILFSANSQSVIQEFETLGNQRQTVSSTIHTFLMQFSNLQSDDPARARVVLSEAFRAVQIARVNRLTKMYKTKNNDTVLSDISKLKIFENLTNNLGEENDQKPPRLAKTTQNLNRNYKLSTLDEIQLNIPSDTIVIAAFDDWFDTNFVYISNKHFDPMFSYVDIDELSLRMASVISSAQSDQTAGQFDYESANWIYSNIFKPESDYHQLDEEIKNIVFLPSKTMFNFPISLLHNGKKIQTKNTDGGLLYDTNGFLIDDYYISYAVDFSDGMFGGSKTQMTADYEVVESSTFFAFADPYLGNDKAAEMRGITYVDIYQPDLMNLPLDSLPETLDEVNAAAQYFSQNNVTIMSGETATKKNILALPFNEYDVLMFSTHGISSGGIPGFQGSGLLLSVPITSNENLGFEDILLTPEDVLGLNLNADIVILNACESGISDVANAPGLTGLAQSFLAAGSEAVMVTHWPISSATTVQITKRMFETIKQDPKASFNRALTDAQLSIKSDPKTQHPFYWAPYNIYGNF